MDLGLTEAQEILKTAAADFVRQEYDKDTLIALEKTPTGITTELFRQAADLGWLGILIPESYGGTDRSLTDTAVLFEELGRGPVLGPHFSSSVLGTLIVLLGGTEAQKQELLTGAAQGTTVLSVAVTEPHYGWNPDTLHMPASRQGGHYILNGTKLFVHDAQAATHLLCAARTAAPDNGPGSGITFFVVEADSPGVAIRTLPGWMSQVDEIRFDNVRVPAFNLVGGENNGWQVATTHLELEHGGGGIVRRNRIVDQFLEYCTTTKHNGATLSQNADVRDDMVDVYVKSEINRLFGLRTYWLSHAHKPRSYEGPQGSYYRKVTALEMAETMLRALGPYAMTNDPQWGPLQGLLEHYQRAAVVGLHPGGTTDIQKVVMSRRIGIGRTAKEQAGRLR
jgi:alkylation response protein AidB-like acyl-CoA dehydrogenase